MRWYTYTERELIMLYNNKPGNDVQTLKCATKQPRLPKSGNF